MPVERLSFAHAEGGRPEAGNLETSGSRVLAGDAAPELPETAGSSSALRGGAQ